MSDKIDMSLDDIIKKNKIGRGGSGGGRGRGGAGGRGGVKRSGSAGRGGAGKSFRGAGRSSRGGATRSPYSRGNAEGSWKHDMYDGPRRGGIVSESGPGKLVVSNLDFGVSDSDIRELFSEFGKLRTAAVHYDKSGRSLGTADVVYDRKSDAVKAMKQYNGVPLDGRAMHILMATSEVSASSRPMGSRIVPRTKSFDGPRSSGGRVNKPFRGGAKRVGGGGDGAARGRGGKRGGRGAKREPAPSREDLDKELDSYLKAR